jgi:hypothetical protein
MLGVETNIYSRKYNKNQVEDPKMPLMTVCYANDKDLLEEIQAALEGHVDAIEEPVEVESPATLNLDLATIAQNVWELLIAFGSIKASVQAIEIIVKLLRERATKERTSKIEFTVPSGIKITLEGNMTPEQVAQEVKRYETALKNSDEVSKQ